MTGLGIHAVVYVVVNLLLFAVWVLLGGSASDIPTYLTNLGLARQAQFWPIYSIVFWGAGLAIHAGVVLMTLPRRYREARARRRSRDNIHRTVLGILDGTMLEGAALAAIRATDGDKAAKRVKKQVRRARRERAGRDRRKSTPAVRSDSRSPRAPDGRPADTGSPGGDKAEKTRKKAAPAAASGRHWVAVMFTDIVDSTRLNHQLGDDTWAEVLTAHRATVRTCVAAHGGAEVGTQGDGFLLRFSSPDAAVACASELQRRWSAARVEAATGDGAPVPAVRIGMHVGEVVHDDDDLVGKVINLAARVTDVAGADEILVTEPVADHLTSEVRFVDRGLKALKGFDQPRHLLAVVWQDAPDVVELDRDTPTGAERT
jgi:class 3 adenylate cyclase